MLDFYIGLSSFWSRFEMNKYRNAAFVVSGFTISKSYQRLLFEIFSYNNRPLLRYLLNNTILFNGPDPME